MALGTEVAEYSGAMLGAELAPFQRRWVRGTFRPGVDLSVLSVGRGNGKSWLVAQLMAQVMLPSSPLWSPGFETVVLAGSIPQARIPFRMARRFMRLEGEPADRGDGGRLYAIVDGVNGLKMLHKPTGTELRVLSSDSKRAFGLGESQAMLIGDEPGAWQERSGARMFEALETAGGKTVGMKVILIGTRAPGAVGGWWRDLVDTPPDGADRWMARRGSRAAWRTWATVRRANPAVSVSPALEPKLRNEWRRAHKRERPRLTFFSYRLNVPVRAPRSVLLTAAQWAALKARDVPGRDGRPVLGVDMGSNRAWTCGALVWSNGRTECLAVAPGIPSLHEQEARDAVEVGTYTALERAGVLRVDPGREVVQPSVLANWALEAGPSCVIGDAHPQGLRVREAGSGRAGHLRVAPRRRPRRRRT